MLTHVDGFLINFSIILAVAAAITVLFHKIRQPVVLGYLLAGMILGPYVPLPIFADPKMTRELAELGVVLMMFSIGMEFRLKKLIKLAPTAGFIALFQSTLMILLGYLIGKSLGWSGTASLYAGAIIAISSTIIIAKVFNEQKMHGKAVDLVYGILIGEDLIAILLLVLFPFLATDRQFPLQEFGKVFSSLLVFLLAIIVLGRFIVPRLVRFVVGMERPEITTIFSIGFCFCLAMVAKFYGFSVALGAFLAGTLVAESNEEAQIEQLIQPLKDIFSAVFFVAVGMLIQPNAIIEHWMIIMLFVLLVIFGKILSVTLGALLTGFDLRTALTTGLSLTQIGEFSFLIAGVGVATEAVNDFLYSLAVAVAAITTLTTPWMISSADRMAKYIERKSSI